jgi:hypothetical protein
MAPYMAEMRRLNVIGLNPLTLFSQDNLRLNDAVMRNRTLRALIESAMLVIEPERDAEPDP